MSKAAFCSIRNIGRICKHLIKDAAETIIHAFVTSKLDSNNSLLYGITNTQVARLQRLQNIAARIITYTKRTDHISPVLANLHWLPVEQRLIYKLCLIVYKIMHNKAPKYRLTLLNHMFRDIGGNAPQHKSFYRKEIQKINGVTEVFGLQHQFYGTICHIM